MAINVVIGIVIGFLVATALYFAILWEKFSDHGGSILIDLESGVYRILLNDDPEDWGDEKFVILKVTNSEQRLKRLNDVDPMSLEDYDEIQ